MKKKALICGVSGQDGSLMARFLLDKGYDVWGTSRDAAATGFSNLLRLGVRDAVHLTSMSLLDFRSILTVVERVEPDEIYNFAGQSSVGLSFQEPFETMQSHVIGTLNMLEVIRFTGRSIRFYNAGSSECFGYPTAGPLSESDPFRPLSPYAVAKAAAFWETANYRDAYGLHASSGILFNHESPLRPTRFVTRKIISAACRIAGGSSETLVLGDLSIKRDWGWAPEYMDAVWRMLQLASPEDFVIATGEANALQDFVAAAFDCVGLDWKDHVRTESSLHRPSEIRENRGDTAKAEEKLGWIASKKMHEVVKAMVDAERGLAGF